MTRGRTIRACSPSASRKVGLPTNQSPPMNYLREIEHELKSLVPCDECRSPKLVAFVKSRVLESYKNGLRDARKRGSPRAAFDRKRPEAAH